jgi:hypothetical protein
MKELIQAEIDKIPEQELNNLYQWIKEFSGKINNMNHSKTFPSNSYPYHDLDYLSGTWTKEDETEFLLNTQQFNEIDKKLWQ